MVSRELCELICFKVQILTSYMTHWTHARVDPDSFSALTASRDEKPAHRSCWGWSYREQPCAAVCGDSIGRVHRSVGWGTFQEPNHRWKIRGDTCQIARRIY